MPLFMMCIIGSWAVFLLVWIVSAVFTKRNLPSRARRAGWLIRLVLAVIAVGVLTWKGQLGSAAQHASDAAAFTQNPILGWAGAFCAVVGIALAVWARMYLGRNWGMPMSKKENPELVTTGPYAYIRHPIYTGVILGILGSALGANLYWLVIAFVSFVYFSFSAMREERLMMTEFPETYPAYRAQTKRFIPFIW